MKLSGLDRKNVDILAKETLLSDFFYFCKYTIRHSLFSGGKTSKFQRSSMLRSPSVGVVLYDPDKDTVVMIEQFRIGALLADEDPWLLEIVAGITEKGESLEQSALREVKEESNCELTRLLPIMNILTSPGCSNEKLHLYCGIVDSTTAGGIYGVDKEHEDIRVHTFSFNDAYTMVNNNRITNGPAIIAIQWLQIHRHELQNEKILS